MSGWHGTLGGYNNHGCRCAACRTANRDYQREYRSRVNGQPVNGQLRDEERFYVVQTSGYTGLSKHMYEHEYAVVDEATAQTVALFIASYGTRNRAGFAERKREAHRRARRLCRALNAREDGRQPTAGELLDVGRYVRVRDGREAGEWEEE